MWKFEDSTEITDQIRYVEFWQKQILLQKLKYRVKNYFPLIFLQEEKEIRSGNKTFQRFNRLDVWELKCRCGHYRNGGVNTDNSIAAYTK